MCGSCESFAEAFDKFNFSKESNKRRSSNKELTALRITIMDYFNIISVKTFFNKRNKNMSHPRGLFYYISTELLKLTHKEVSAFLGVDESSVSYGKRKIKNQLSINDSVTITDLTNIKVTLLSRKVITL